MTLTWGQIFKIIFQGQIIVHSTRLNKRKTMLVKWIWSCLYWVGSYYRKSRFTKTAIFYFCSREVKPLTLGQIWGRVSDRALKELSNAFFCDAVALLIPELCADLWKKCWRRQNLTLDNLTFDLTYKWPEQFRHDFLRSFECRLPRVATWPRSRVRGGVQASRSGTAPISNVHQLLKGNCSPS